MREGPSRVGARIRATLMVVLGGCLAAAGLAVAASPEKGRAYVGKDQQGPVHFQVAADGKSLSDFFGGSLNLPCNGANGGSPPPTTAKIVNGKFTISWSQGGLSAVYKGQFVAGGKADGTSFYKAQGAFGGGCQHTYSWSVKALPANAHLCADHIGPPHNTYNGHPIGAEASETDIIATSVTCPQVYQALDAGKFTYDKQADLYVSTFTTPGWSCSETSSDHYKCSRSSPKAAFTFTQDGQPCGYPGEAPGPQCRTSGAADRRRRS